MQLHALAGVGQVGLRQRVVEQPRHAPQQELEVLVAVDAGQVVDEQVVGQRLHTNNNRTYVACKLCVFVILLDDLYFVLGAGLGLLVGISEI